MSKSPTVTIVMPAYNVELYIEKSIESVLNQTDMDWELIIVNDGSTDSTQNIIERYCKLDSRIKSISQENRGVSSARNKGMDLARGLYISFLDADDQYESDYIKAMKTALIREKAKVAFCKFKELDDKKILKQTPQDIQILYDGSFIKHIMKHTHSKINMGFMYDIAWLKKNNIVFDVNLSHAEDTIFILQAIYKAKVVFVPFYLYLYIYRENSVSRSEVTAARLIDKINTYKFYWSFFRNKDTPEGIEISDYLAVELVTLYENLKRQLWRLIKKKRYTTAKEAISYFISSEDWGDYVLFIYRKGFFKKVFNFLKWRVILSNNLNVWKITAPFL